jgi:hypothetical protein
MLLLSSYRKGERETRRRRELTLLSTRQVAGTPTANMLLSVSVTIKRFFQKGRNITFSEEARGAYIALHQIDGRDGRRSQLPIRPQGNAVHPGDALIEGDHGNGDSAREEREGHLEDIDKRTVDNKRQFSGKSEGGKGLSCRHPEGLNDRQRLILFSSRVQLQGAGGAEKE